MNNPITYNKLVRDRIPEIIHANGQTCHAETLSDQDYIQALRKKIIEEAHEVAEAERGNLIKELADLYEVIDALAKVAQIDHADIIARQTKRRLERGGFDNKIYLVSVG